VDVVLGAPANTICDVDVTLNSLTIKTNGGVIGFGANVNVTASTFDFQGDGSLTNGGGITIASGGTLVKSGGTGNFNFGSSYAATSLMGHSPTIEVKSGTLAFPAGNNYTRLDGGGTFAISNNATLNLVPDNNTGTSLIGDFTGIGGGTIIFNTGSLISFPGPGFSLNFPGNMFQWTGGQMYNLSATNLGTINISNTPTMNGLMYNSGTIKLADGSALSVNNYCYNQSGGTIDFQGDAGLASGSIFVNSGLLKKSAGSGISQIFPVFQNYGGTVEVDSGTLAVGLNQNDGISNATFIVHSGATFDLSISNNNTTIAGLLTGSGGGTVLMNSGTVFSYDQATLNFPGAMFQWQGGSLGGGNGYLTNVGTLNISGSVGSQAIANNGNMIQSGIGAIEGGSGYFDNNTNGVYQIQNDNGVAVNYFYNYGLLEKTGGSGTSVISATFNNSGAIQPASGKLLFTGGFFYQNAGTLQITPAITFTNEYFYLSGGTVTGVGTVGDNYMFADGGVLAPGNPFGTLNVSGGLNIGGAFNVVLGGPNQFSQLAVSGSVGVNYNAATLNVTLTNGYVPPIGTQFQIISSASFGGGFATLNVPAGISVNYSNSGVYLIVTGSTPVKLQSPQISGGNFVFSFGTTNGLGYTVQQNTNLATSNWIYYTNIIGNGSLYQFTTPATNTSQNFFRVRQP
jgi:hypothetical protein